MNGLLIIDKEKKMTSQDVCLRLKKILNVKKCGHNGTLDPNATGVMVIGVNQGTKTLKLLNEHDKEYIATIIFGIDTDTLDLDGNVINTISMEVTENKIIDGMEYLKSQKQQIPPLTSAVKVNGKKLYEYQRKGISVDIPKRDVTLYNYEIVSPLRMVDSNYEIDIKVSVSKGYFIRSMARDLGAYLGGCAVIKDLRRTKSGEYKIEDAKKISKVKKSDIIPIKEFFKLPKVMVKDYMIPLVKNGITMDQRQTDIHGAFFVDSKEGILAIYEEVAPLKYKPLLIFGGDNSGSNSSK